MDRKRFPPFFYISLINIAGCSSQNEELRKYDLNPVFSKIVVEAKDSSQLVKLDLTKELSLIGEWDSIVVIKPYLMLKKLEWLNLKNLSSLKPELETTVLQDNQNTLLFLRDRKIVGYAIVGRRPVDFASLEGEIPILKKTAANNLLLREHSYKEDIYFEIVRQ